MTQAAVKHNKSNGPKAPYMLSDDELRTAIEKFETNAEKHPKGSFEYRLEMLAARMCKEELDRR